MKLGRRLTLLLMLTLHATTSLCGPGHHAVDGLIERIVGKSCSAADCDLPGEAFRVESDCPVCAFLTLVPPPIERPPTVPTGAVRPSGDLFETTEVVRLRFAVSIPRAPPRVDA